MTVVWSERSFECRSIGGKDTLVVGAAVMKADRDCWSNGATGSGKGLILSMQSRESSVR